MVEHLVLLFIAVVVLALPAAVWAAPTNPHGLAVIIGNKSYTHADVPPVDYAHRDAQAFKRYVLDVLGYAPDNVIHLEDATRRRMIKVFGSPGAMMNDIQARLNILAPGDGADVVVYYSGHGVPGKDGGASLLPADIPPHEAQTESYSLKLLYEKLGALQHANTVRVFLDACFSGSSDGGRLVGASPVYQEPAFPEAVTENMMILTAVTGSQLATWDKEARHGLFTHHLLDALYGKADTDGNGEVTAREAQRYLARVVPSHAWLLNEREQRPKLTTRALSELVLASAGAGGAFPARPELPPAPSAGAAESEVADEAKKDAEVAAEVEDEPEPALIPEEVEQALGLTHGQKELVQHGLVWLGYEIGRVDGVLGRRSQAAIRAYQKEKGLPETGRLTAEVSEALQVLGKRQVEKLRAAERRRKEEARRAAQAREAEEARRRQAEAERKEQARALREPGRRFRDCEGSWCPELVVVPAGSYMMGSPESEAGRFDREDPRHRVRIAKPFAVGMYEVTRGEFGRFVRETGEAYRLLSESEWEYMARAGTGTSRYWGNGETGQCAHANGADRALKRRYDDWKWATASCDDGQIHTAPVGSYRSNGYGLRDVLGNVWEWVEDCWHDGYGGAPGDGRAWTGSGAGLGRQIEIHRAKLTRQAVEPRRAPNTTGNGLSPGLATLPAPLAALAALARTQVELLDVAAAPEPLGGTVHHDPADLHDIAVVRDVERGPCVLLHHQHGDPAFLVEAADDGEDVADEDGRQAERGLVEQHDLRPRHESARDGEHLLLPAGERARGLAKPLAEDREVAEYHLQVLVHAVVVSRIRPHREVLTDGEQRKHLPALGHVHDPLAHDPVRIAALDGLPGQANLALLGVHDAGDGPKQGGLPRSVRAQHCDDPPFRHVEAHAANRHDRPVEALEVADLEKRVVTAHAAAPVPAPASVS